MVMKEGICDACGADKPITGLLQFGHCKCRSYCNHECQLKAWPNHKVVCNRDLEMLTEVATGNTKADKGGKQKKKSG